MGLESYKSTTRYLCMQGLCERPDNGGGTMRASSVSRATASTARKKADHHQNLIQCQRAPFNIDSSCPLRKGRGRKISCVSSLRKVSASGYPTNASARIIALRGKRF